MVVEQARLVDEISYVEGNMYIESKIVFGKQKLYKINPK